MHRRPIFLLLLLSVLAPLPLFSEDIGQEQNVFVAINNNDMAMFEDLLKNHREETLAARFGSSGDSALHRAAFNDRMEMVDALLRAGADVNVPNVNGFTPLHSAVRNLDCVRLLLRGKAKVNVAAHGVWTPLHLAAIVGNADVADALVKAGADKTALAQGRTASQLAAEKGYAELAEKLRPEAPAASPAPAPAESARSAAAPKPAAEPAAEPVAAPEPPAAKPEPPAAKSSVRIVRRRNAFDQSIYEGETKDGKTPQGHGKMTYRTGEVYDGYWRKGVRTGSGTFTYANGDRYTGTWRNDVPDGNGHFEYANGGHADGVWKRGVFWEGQGVLATRDGNRYECLWEDGECVSQIPVAGSAPAAN